MLLAEKVTYKYAGAEKPSIVNANAFFSKGTINLLWGDNGSGKTTLAMILCGAIPHLINGEFSGNVSWDDTPISSELISHLSSFVFQNPYIYFQGYTIQDEISLIANTDSKLIQIAKPLLPNIPLETPLHKLSHGQQQRVALYSAILQPDPLIFLDEPFEFLDDSGVKQATELITNAAKDDRIIIVIQRPQREISIDFSKGYQVLDGRVCEAFPEKPNVLPTITNLSSNSPNFIIDDVSFNYSRDSAFSIRKASLSILEGESVGLIGPNGCGKTTLFLVACGLLNPKHGNILVKHKQLNGKALRREVKCSFQNPENQLFGSTVKEELEFGLRNLNLDHLEIGKRVEQISDCLPFGLSTDPFQLSYGQKKILGIIATFLMKPQVVLLDEPMAGLDFKSIMTFYKLAEAFLKRGGSLLISSHSMSEVKTLCHRVLVMRDGEIIDELSLR